MKERSAAARRCPSLVPERTTRTTAPAVRRGLRRRLRSRFQYQRRGSSAPGINHSEIGWNDSAETACVLQHLLLGRRSAAMCPRPPRYCQPGLEEAVAGQKSCNREGVFLTHLCSRCEQVVATLASAGTFWSSRRQPAVASTSHVVLRARNRAWERHSNGVTFWSECSWRLDRRKFFWFDLNKHNVERNAVLFRQRHPVLLSTSNSEREVAKHEPDRSQMCGRLRDPAWAAI